MHVLAIMRFNIFPPDEDGEVEMAVPIDAYLMASGNGYWGSVMVLNDLLDTTEDGPILSDIAVNLIELLYKLHPNAIFECFKDPLS